MAASVLLKTENRTLKTSSTFAPGRVELLGNHTDYNAGVVLSAALDLRITATGRRREDTRIVLSSEGTKREADVGQIEPMGAWSDYPLGVFKLLREAGNALGGFEASYTSTLPQGAGLSSSAALEVSTALLLARLYELRISPLDLARLCRRAENEFVGVNCGLLDQATSMFGKMDQAVYLDCRSESVSTIPMPDSVALLIVDSAVKHALTGGEYNERRESCFAAAEAMGVSALRDIGSLELAAADLPDLLKRRAAHVVGEMERVFAAEKMLRSGDMAGFGRLMTESHRSSQFNFENSTPELDVLVEITTRQNGVHGARLTGGGFGGAIVALVDKAAIDTVADAVVREYRQSSGHEGVAHRCRIGDGAWAAQGAEA